MGLATWTRGAAVLWVAAALLPGPAPRQAAIESVAVGDFDGDGVPDVAVVQNKTNYRSLREATGVRAFSGKTGTCLWTYLGEERDILGGQAIAAIGDIDGDGATDLAVGAPSSGDDSRIDLMSGKTSRKIRSARNKDVLVFGHQLYALGDGSGRNPVDVLVGGMSAWTCVTSGREGMGPVFKNLGETGATIVPVGDVDGDGTCDMAIDSQDIDESGTRNPGRIRVLSGAALRKGKPDPALLDIQEKPPFERLGDAIAAAGDWDGDGKADILVGCPAADDAGSTWTVGVLSGKNGSVLWKGAGRKGEVHMHGVAILGDLDRDNRPEVAVSFSRENRGDGAVVAVSTRDGSVLWTLEGTRGVPRGMDLIPAGDADGDGIRDLIAVSHFTMARGDAGNGYLRLVAGKDGKVIRRFDDLAAK